MVTDITKQEKDMFDNAETKQKFELEDIVYASQLNCYVQIMKFD